MGKGNVHKKPLSSAALAKIIPPSMLPINPLDQPLAKVKLEKLESSQKKRKKNSKDSDELSISHLKARVSKSKVVVKKLF
ncbi:unnamed protein product [Linum tenue]|nr:unnamed protein product [Linum tenue]